MKHIFFPALLVCLLLTATTAPVCADDARPELRLKNQTPYTLFKISVLSKSGGAFSKDLTFVPGSLSTFSLDGLPVVTSIKLSTGFGLMEFTGLDLSNVGGIEGTLSFNDAGKPVLSLGAQEAASGDAGGGASEHVGTNGEIQVEAGPIWSNDHAQERCPEVLVEWMETTGQKAEWKGHWMTTVEGEMSVCVLNVQGAENEMAAPHRAEDEKAAPADAANSIVGTYKSLLARDDSGGVAIEDLLAVDTLAKVRVLAGLPPAKGMSEKSLVLELKVRFADQTWLAQVYPPVQFGTFGEIDENTTAPGKMHLTAYADGQARHKVVEALRGMAWRPWFIQTMSGEILKFKRGSKLFEKADNEEAVWAEVLADFDAIGNTPTEVSCLLLDANNFETANAGHTLEMPTLTFKAGNAENMRLDYFHDGSMFVQITRK